MLYTTGAETMEAKQKRLRARASDFREVTKPTLRMTQKCSKYFQAKREHKNVYCLIISLPFFFLKVFFFVPFFIFPFFFFVHHFCSPPSLFVGY
jgi:hypothetical protein